MAYQQAPFLAAIGAAAGDDHALQAELRHAFADSVDRQIDLLRRARCDGNWHISAQRLHAIANSFHADQLSDLAEQAMASAPGEPTVLADLKRFATILRGQA